MKATSDSIRSERIAIARKRIASGCYDAPGVLEAILSSRLLDEVLNDLDALPVGDGHAYRDTVSECLASSLSHVVDTPLSRTEFAAGGGRGDIDLPVRTEVLSTYPLWDHWARRYDVRSVIVETKNEKAKASFEDIGQLEGYFDHSKLGRLGFFVARKGFSANARKRLGNLARNGSKLIIPLDQFALKEFARASAQGPVRSMEYLRRQETLLMQSA